MIFSFSVKKRGSEEAGDLRQQNQIPGILYAKGKESISVSADSRAFEKLYNEAGESSLIDLTIEGAKEVVKVLVKDIQIDPVKRTITHFDLYQIDMNSEMEVEINLNFVGVSPAVKSLGGTLVTTVETVEATCLPKDLVSEINVDLSVLNTFEDIIRLKDLVLPNGIKLEQNPEMVIAKVQAPLTEEQLKAMEEEGPKSVEEVEVEKKGKEEVEGETEGKKE